MMLSEKEVYNLHVIIAKHLIKKYFASLGLNAYEVARYAFAVNKKENRSFNPKAKNTKSSARGLMQMLIGTQKEIETKYLKVSHKPNRIYEANYAVYLGQYELIRQLKRYKGDWKKAVHAYNRGSYLPNNKKSYTAGEMYANSVMNFLTSTDFDKLQTA